MGGYRLLVKASATKELEAVGTKTDRQRIIARIRALAADPRAEDSGKLGGYAERYRVRQGAYRIIFLVDDERREITIFKIGHRKYVYR